VRMPKEVGTYLINPCGAWPMAGPAASGKSAAWGYDRAWNWSRTRKKEPLPRRPPIYGPDQGPGVLTARGRWPATCCASSRPLCSRRRRRTPSYRRCKGPLTRSDGRTSFPVGASSLSSEVRARRGVGTLSSGRRALRACHERRLLYVSGDLPGFRVWPARLSQAFIRAFPLPGRHTPGLLAWNSGAPAIPSQSWSIS